MNDNYVMDFLESVYPGNAELVAASFNEKAALKDATALIGRLRSDILRLLDAQAEPTSAERAELVEWLDERLGLIYMQLPQMPEYPGYWESVYEEEIEPLEKIRALILSAPAPKVVSRGKIDDLTMILEDGSGGDVQAMGISDVEDLLRSLGLAVEPEAK